MKIAFGLIGGAMLAMASPALAQSYTFTTTGSDSALTGTPYGNTKTIDSDQSTSVKVKVSAWQSNLSTNNITSAWLGAYSGGLGVTGLGDSSGNSNLHQIDNNGQYTDFLLLQFSQAMTLTGIKTNSYGIGGVTDNDAVWYDAGAVAPKVWNAAIPLTTYDTVPSTWSPVAAGGNGVVRATGASISSTAWLVGAAFTPVTDRNDGFKLAGISARLATPTVPPAVPEPATWAMMLVGFGSIGSAMRRGRRRQVAAIA